MTKLLIARLGLDQPYQLEADRKLENFSLLDKIKEMKNIQAMKRTEEERKTGFALALRSLQGTENDSEYQILLQKKADLFLQSIMMIQRALKKLIVETRKKKEDGYYIKMEERHNFFQRDFVKMNFMNNKVLSAYDFLT